MKGLWKRAAAGFMAAAVVLTGGAFSSPGLTAQAADDNKITVDYNTSIGTGSPMLFGGVGTPSKTQDKAWEALTQTMGIKIVKVPIDLGALFPENADNMDTEVFENYAHVAGSILTKVRGSDMKAMLEFKNLPAWLDNGSGMYNDAAAYQKILKKFLGDIKGEYEATVSHVEIVPPSGLSDTDFKNYYFTAARAVKETLADVTVGGMGYKLTSKSDTLPSNVKAALTQSSSEDPSLLQFVSVRGYSANPTADNNNEYFGEFKEGRKAIRTALNNRYMPLYMTGWSTSADGASAADSKVTGEDGIKYHASALFKAMRDGWNLVLFDGTVSSDDQAGSYSYTLDGSGNAALNPFAKIYDLLGNRLGLNKGEFKVVSTNMGSNWPVDDSIAMVNSDNEVIMMLMNFSSAKSNINLELKNVPYEDGNVKLEAYVASSSQDSSQIFATINGQVTNGILSAVIPTVPVNSAMGLVVKEGTEKNLPAQSMYEFESQDNHFGGNTEIAWVTAASFNRVVKNFGGENNFVTLQKVAADGTGTYTAHLYANTVNSNIKVSVNGGTPAAIDGSSLSLSNPVSFEVSLNAGSDNTLKFYTESGELQPDRLVLEPKDVQLSIGFQNLKDLEKSGDRYILPLAKTDFKVDARVFPEASSAGKTISFESSDTAVAEISSNGTLTPKKAGDCTITASIDGTDVENSFDLTVKNSVASVTVSPSSLTLKQGSTSELTAVVLPTGAENKAVTWISSDDSVVSITRQDSTSAAIKAVAETGTAVITATTADGGKTSTCAVTVVKPVAGGNVTVDYGNTISTGDPKIFGVTHYPSVNKTDSDIGDHSEVWPMLTNEGGVRFMRADARLQEILPIWTKRPNTNWEAASGQGADQPSYVKSDYYYVKGPDGVNRKFNLNDYKADMEYYEANGTYLNGLSNPENWNTSRLLSWVDAADKQGYEVMAMTFQIPEWLSAGQVVSGDPHTKKVCNGAPKDWGVYRDIVKKVYKLLRGKIDYYEFLNEPHWYIPTHGDQRDPSGVAYSGSNIVNEIAADQFYQAIDAIYEAEEEITGQAGAKPKVKLGGGADDSWGGEYGVLGTLFSSEYAAWKDRVEFVSIHKYGDRPANQDDSNSGANSRNVKFWLRQKTGRDIPLFLNEYNISTGQPTDETYGYKSVGWHAKNLIDMMVDGYSGGGYYTCYPADVPMDDYEASSGWIERGKGMYTWNSGDPYLANFTRTWGLMSKTLGLGDGAFKVKSTQIEGQMSHAVGAVNASGNAVAFVSNYSNKAYDNVAVKMENVPYAAGTQVTASIHSLTYNSDMGAAPKTKTATVDSEGNVTIEIPEIAAWGVAGVLLSGTKENRTDKTYEFEAYQNTFKGNAKIEKSAKASNGRWLTGAVGSGNSVTVPVSKSGAGMVSMEIHYEAASGNTLNYVINGSEKTAELPAASDNGKVEIKETLNSGTTEITFYGNSAGLMLDKLVVSSMDKNALQQLVDREFTKEGYTDKSWAVYEKAKKAAVAVLNNNKATPAEVEKAYENLSKAIDQLEAMVDLPGLITEAGKKSAADYTTQTWVAFNWALEKAKAASGDKNVSQEDQIKAYKELDEAIKALSAVQTDMSVSLNLGKMPTSNVTVANADKATDGDTGTSDSDANSFAQMEAGEETGGADNGYSGWNDVYLQYDFGADYLVSEVDIYRTIYASGDYIRWKECKVELSETPDFSADSTTQIAYDETLRTEAGQTTPQKISLNTRTPVKARYLRVSGRGHQGSWGGYSNKVNFSEIQAFGTFAPDKEYLNDLVDETKGLNESNYTPATWGALQEKIEAAKKLGDSATLEQMNRTAADLYTAMQSLKEKADSTALKAAVKKLGDAMSKSGWKNLTAKEREPFTRLKAEAEALASGGEASKEEAEEMEKKVSNALKELDTLYVKAEARKALRDKISEAEKMNLSGYTAKSVNAFKKTLNEAKTVLNASSSDAQAYRAASGALAEAVGGLVKVTSDDPNTPNGNKPDGDKGDGNKGDANKSDTNLGGGNSGTGGSSGNIKLNGGSKGAATGDNTNALLLLTGLILSAAAAGIILRRRRRA